MIYDKFLKMTKYILVLKTLNASGLIDIFIREIIYIYKKLNDIVTDKEIIFTSAYWQDLYCYLKIRYKLSIAFHSQTNNQTKY